MRKRVLQNNQKEIKEKKKIKTEEEKMRKYKLKQTAKWSVDYTLLKSADREKKNTLK
jgi:hypothetical protein